MNNKEYQQLLKKNSPWLSHLSNARTRCNNPNSNRYYCYGARGIKCFLSNDDIKDIWIRDNANDMVQPEIDRIDNNGNYTLENCRFIEHKINTSKDRIKPILQYSLDGEFIREWKSLSEASKELQLSISCLSYVLNGKRNRKQTGGFVWRYK